MKKYLFASTLLVAGAVFTFAEGDGSSGSPYTGEITDLDLSGTYTDNTAYINGVTGGFVSGDKEFTTNVNIGEVGLTITSGSGEYTYTFSGTITGSGNWTCNATLSQNYIFTGDLSGYSGDIYFSDGVFGDANPSVSTITFGDGSVTSVKGSVSGTGGLIFHGTVTYNYGKGETAVVIGNSYSSSASYDIKVKDLVIGGTADYVINSNIDGYFNSTVSRNTMTITTSGTVTFNCSSITQMGLFTASNTETTLVFTQDCTLGITYGDQNYGIDVAGTIQVADGKTLTINKSGTAYAKVGTLELGSNSNLTLSKANGATSSEAHGLYIGTLKIGTGSSIIKITGDSNYINVGELVGANVALTLTSDASTTHVNVFELGSSTHEDGYVSTSQFSGTITVSDTNTGSGRGVSLAISDEKIASGAVIVLGEEDNSNTSLSLGINASRVEIAGLSTTSTMGADVLYAGKIAVDTEAGNAGGSITSNSSTRNTLAINTATSTSYTFSGEVLNMLNIEKSGTGKQAFVFATGSTFDGSIVVKAGELALSGEAISSTGITVDSGATLTIGNTVTLATTSDVSEVSSRISGTVTITGELDVGATTMTLDTTLGSDSSTGTVAFATGAELILSDTLLGSVDGDAITIITAGTITYNGTELSEATVEGFAEDVISWSDSYELSNWTYSNGTLSASVTYLPEPSMFGMLLGLGAIGLVSIRRRRKSV